ncbi:MAG: hypothetical protein ACK5HY_03565, partial [Parahaliea sp.]
MNLILKVFCNAGDQARLAASYPVIEHYDGFILLEVPAEDREALARTFTVDDVSTHYRIRVDEKLIDTQQARIDARGRQRAHPAYRGARRLSAAPHHYLVQFVGPVKEAWLREVEGAGGELRTPFADYTYIVRADDSARQAIAGLPCVRWMGHLRHEHRLSEGLRRGLASAPVRELPRTRVLYHQHGITGISHSELPRTRVLPGAYTLEFFDGADMEAGLAAVEALGFRVGSSDAGAALAVVHDPGKSGGKKRLRELAAVHGVWKIRPLMLKRPSNDVAATIMGIGLSLDVAGLGLSGAGEIIAIADTGIDTGDPATLHPDFAGRVRAITSLPMAPGYADYVTNAGADDGPADLD